MVAKDKPVSRLVTIGAYVMMLGGLMLASSYVADPPAAIIDVGWLLFLGGAVLVGIGGGFRLALSALWQLFP